MPTQNEKLPARRVELTARIFKPESGKTEIIQITLHEGELLNKPRREDCLRRWSQAWARAIA